MGRLTPIDIGTYVYCPKLYERRGQKIIAKPLTFFESMLRKAFIEGERSALIKDSLIDPRKLSRTWDKIWFPAATKRGIKMSKASDKTLDASIKFADYCKYDITDYTYPTAGTGVKAYINIGEHKIEAHADLLKMDMTTRTKSTVIVNFTNNDLSISESALSPIIRTNAYIFYRDKGEYVTHVNVNLSDKNEKLKMTVSTFSPKEMDDTRKMLYHIERGIRNNAFYHNPSMCEECKQCPNFS